MAVTADGTYRGGSFTGVQFTVTSAYIKQWSSGGDPALVYTVDVETPDGVARSVPEWASVKADPDLTEGHGTPMEQAEAHMQARLTAAGWSNIQSDLDDA